MLINLKKLSLSYLSNISKCQPCMFEWQVFVCLKRNGSDIFLYCAKTLEDVLLKEKIYTFQFYNFVKQLKDELPDYDKIPHGVSQFLKYDRDHGEFDYDDNIFFKIPPAENIQYNQVILINIIGGYVKWTIRVKVR